MANSKYEYVRLFEQPDSLLANTWIVVRIDGRGFSKLTTKYKFVKPNDRDALDLMNAAAEAVMKELPDLVLAYGNSDEYSFVFHKDCALFERRASKLTTTITSTFTSYYVFLWPKYFPEKPLTPPLPSFDGRAVCYPSDLNLRDYMSWRQVDCHINNLYNTTFWTLVQQGGLDPREAEQRLSGTVSSDKNEILFKDFGINYNNEPECFKKGTVLYRDFFNHPEKPTSGRKPQQTLPTIASPQPRRLSHQQLAVADDKTATSSIDDHLVSPLSGDPGPTFLSTTSTPSPPPSPQTMSRSALPNPLRSNPISPRTSTYPPVSMPLSPPCSVTSPTAGMYASSGPGKQFLPNLTPLPMSPPILRPSTKPPLSLEPPNPTTRDNFSPTTTPRDFPAAFQVQGYRHNVAQALEKPGSHSASASLTVANASAAQPPKLKHRSPSQPHLPSYFSAGSTQQPPAIPLRISSIPANNKPRKLSLQHQRSLSTLRPGRPEEGPEAAFSAALAAASTTPPPRSSPPLRTNKALPSPPMSARQEDETRERVRGNSPKSGSPRAPAIASPYTRTSEPLKRDGFAWHDFSRTADVEHPGIAELPAAPARRAASHSRLQSAPTFATLQSPHQAPDVHALSTSTATSSKPQYLTLAPFPDAIDTSDIQPTPPLKDSPRSRTKFSRSPPHAQNVFDRPVANESTKVKTQSQLEYAPAQVAKKGKEKVTDQGGLAAGTEGRPAEMSRNQRDKDKKKRSKAKVLCEHVDIIKDEFWEKRPWILSGKAG